MRETDATALLLNADFRPVSLFPLLVVSRQEAVHHLVRGRVAVAAEHDRWVRSPSLALRLPSVVALERYRKPREAVPFTPYNAFLRDRLTCQYCPAVRPVAELTFDHVRPRALGVETHWTKCGDRVRPLQWPQGRVDADATGGAAEGADGAGADARPQRAAVAPSA